MAEAKKSSTTKRSTKTPKTKPADDQTFAASYRTYCQDVLHSQAVTRTATLEIELTRLDKLREIWAAHHKAATAAQRRYVSASSTWCGEDAQRLAAEAWHAYQEALHSAWETAEEKIGEVERAKCRALQALDSKMVDRGQEVLAKYLAAVRELLGEADVASIAPSALDGLGQQLQAVAVHSGQVIAS